MNLHTCIEGSVNGTTCSMALLAVETGVCWTCLDCDDFYELLVEDGIGMFCSHIIFLMCNTFVKNCALCSFSCECYFVYCLSHVWASLLTKAQYTLLEWDFDVICSAIVLCNFVTLVVFWM